MTKKDLKQLGFKKVKVSAEESGDKPFYYYTYDFKNAGYLSLISCDSDTVKSKDDWTVQIFECGFKPIKKKSRCKAVIRILDSL